MDLPCRPCAPASYPIPGFLRLFCSFFTFAAAIRRFKTFFQNNGFKNRKVANFQRIRPKASVREDPLPPLSSCCLLNVPTTFGVSPASCTPLVQFFRNRPAARHGVAKTRLKRSNRTTSLERRDEPGTPRNTFLNTDEDAVQTASTTFRFSAKAYFIFIENE